MLFILYMDEISALYIHRMLRTRLGQWNLYLLVILALIYAGDTVFIAYSPQKLQQAVIEWYEDLRRKGMKTNIDKSDVLQVSRTQEDIHIS